MIVSFILCQEKIPHGTAIQEHFCVGMSLEFRESSHRLLSSQEPAVRHAGGGESEWHIQNYCIYGIFLRLLISSLLWGEM